MKLFINITFILLLNSCGNFFEERITFVELEITFNDGSTSKTEYNYTNYSNLGPTGHYLEDGCLSIKGIEQYCGVRFVKVISRVTECPTCK